jgi:mannose/fructose/N-acetylgalactosamine-specific phosphotransferase system component IID
MTGRGRALLRLMAVQGAWSYERMIGIGMGHAAAPLLADLEQGKPERHREATARSAEFFNCNPYLAGLALGASVRAEHDGVPGAQIQRLRTALCSPLGALGDQVFWAGLVPILMSLALAAIALGGRGWVLVVAVVSYNLLRLLVTRWALATGLESGMQVGTAISASWLPRIAASISGPAGFVAGLAIPLAGAWLLSPLGSGALLLAGASAAVALVLSQWSRTRWTSLHVGLLLAALSLLWTRLAP